MKFTPKTEEQLQQERIMHQASLLLQRGIGSYEIIEAYETFNEKQQCDMLTLKMKCWDYTGKQGIVFDNLFATGRWEWKFRHFCYSAGIGHLYEKAEISAEELVGLCGKMNIDVSFDKKKVYPPKNVITDYVLSDDSIKPSRKKEKVDEFDQDVPF